jgi:aminopeptidase-like protein
MPERQSRALGTGVDFSEAGEWMYARVREWYPLCRSITGQGLRDTLAGIAGHAPITVRAVPSGTPAFDWTIPKEWSIRDAYIKNAAGERVVDFHAHNLHVMSYSTPVAQRMALAELRKKCFTLPDHPDWIPYRTSYYREDWGFCLTQHQLDGMTEEAYEVCIDSSLDSGVLNYGELLLRGETEEEVLLSAHVCHPSLANDNLSGVALALYLARLLSQRKHRYSYRFVFAPGTIGAIAWLAQNADHARKYVRHGLILACVGDGGPFRYKRTRQEHAKVDVAAAHVLSRAGRPHEILPFIPYGYDERQYCSPGFNLPVGCFMRSGPGGYAEYHSSADNLELVRPEHLAESLDALLAILDVLEGDAVYQNRSPNGEPQLGKRGLYSQTGGLVGRKSAEMGLLWVLNYSDGSHSLLDIAERSGIAFEDIRLAADALVAADLLGVIT